jgi:hypothetical protein
MMQSSVLESLPQAGQGQTSGRAISKEGTVLLAYSEQKKKHYIIVKPICRYECLWNSCSRTARATGLQYIGLLLLIVALLLPVQRESTADPDRP